MLLRRTFHKYTVPYIVSAGGRYADDGHEVGSGVPGTSEETALAAETAQPNDTRQLLLVAEDYEDLAASRDLVDRQAAN